MRPPFLRKTVPAEHLVVIFLRLRVINKRGERKSAQKSPTIVNGCDMLDSVCDVQISTRAETPSHAHLEHGRDCYDCTA